MSPLQKEPILKIGMSQLQKLYYKALLEKGLEVNAGGEPKRLLDIEMQLRKCCNYPYLFQGAEPGGPGPPYTTGDHLITSARKIVLLGKLLAKPKEGDTGVLIF